MGAIGGAVAGIFKYSLDRFGLFNNESSINVKGSLSAVMLVLPILAGYGAMNIGNNTTMRWHETAVSFVVGELIVVPPLICVFMCMFALLAPNDVEANPLVSNRV